MNQQRRLRACDRPENQHPRTGSGGSSDLLPRALKVTTTQLVETIRYGLVPSLDSSYCDGLCAGGPDRVPYRQCHRVFSSGKLWSQNPGAHSYWLAIHRPGIRFLRSEWAILVRIARAVEK